MLNNTKQNIYLRLPIQNSIDYIYRVYLIRSFSARFFRYIFITVVKILVNHRKYVRFLSIEVLFLIQSFYVTFSSENLCLFVFTRTQFKTAKLSFPFSMRKWVNQFQIITSNTILSDFSYKKVENPQTQTLGNHIGCDKSARK